MCIIPKAPPLAGLFSCLIFGEGNGEVGGFAGVHHDFEHFPGVPEFAGFYLVVAGLQLAKSAHHIADSPHQLAESAHHIASTPHQSAKSAHGSIHSTVSGLKIMMSRFVLNGLRRHRKIMRMKLENDAYEI